MIKTEIYQPQYYKDFHCTKNECKENCCVNDWRISVDEDIYEKYLQLEGNIKNEILSSIEVVSKNPFMAYIITSKKGHCDFFTESGLCRIHKEFGEGLLGATCKGYPRKICDSAGIQEAYLEVSCEAAAKLILFDEKGIKLERVVWESTEPVKSMRFVAPEKYTTLPNANEVFHLLRATTLMIMQSRQYKLQLRIMILGLLAKQISELLQTGLQSSRAEIEQILTAFTGKIESGFYAPMNDQELTGADFSISFIYDMLKVLEEKNNEVLTRCIHQTFEGLGFKSGEVQQEDVLAAYNKGYEAYLADKEYILENHLVNHILSEGFPFNHRFRDNIMKNYQELRVKYNLVKFMIVGVSIFNNEFDKWRAVECVSSFSRFFDHNAAGALVMD